MARHLEVDYLLVVGINCMDWRFRVGVLVRFKDERDAWTQSRDRYLDGPIEMYVAGSHGIRYLFPIITSSKPLYLHVIKPLVCQRPSII
jgi:hypothetical protein